MSSRVLVALRIAAPPSRVFEAFTAEIGTWWQPNGLFSVSDRSGGRMAIDGRVGGAVCECHPDGSALEIGRVQVWDPPHRLVFGWRAATFPPGIETTVDVRFEEVGAETRVVVEHRGWDSLPQEHAARHGFPLDAFQRRLAEWWQVLLTELGRQLDQVGKVDG